MFQPQPTPLATSFFTSSSPFGPRAGSGFPLASAPPPAAASSPAVDLDLNPGSIRAGTGTSSSNVHSQNQLHHHHHHISTNPHDPVFSSPASTPLPFPLSSQQIPFGYYFPPSALESACGGSGLAAELVGAGSGAAPEAGVTAGAGAGAGAGARRGSAPPSGSTNLAEPAARDLRCDRSLSNNSNDFSQQFCPNVSAASRQTQKPSRQQAQPQRHPRQQPRRPSPSRLRVNMEDQQDPHGMAAQQAAAQDYQPELPVSCSGYLPCSIIGRILLARHIFVPGRQLRP